MRYEAWREAGSILFGAVASIHEQRAKGLLGANSELLYAFDASTWEEASSIHHLRMGFEPYKPLGKAVPCFQCGALTYPEGSGQCWRCGSVGA
jgi:hypothetical protein